MPGPSGIGGTYSIMIDRDEIEEKSQEFEIHASNLQRDYIFGWVLAGIYGASKLADHLILKGGSCLRKAYFENTRFSRDLDFSVETELSEDFLKAEFNTVCDFVHTQTGVKFYNEKNRVGPKRRVDSSKKVYEARLYFNDFYGIESSIIISIRLDITQFDRIYLPVQNRFIIHPYSDRDDWHSRITCVKLEEILASKLKCLLQRRHSCDLYDYVFWLMFDTGLEIDRGEILRTLLKMTIFERSPGVLRGLLIDLPFQVFKAIWHRFLVCPNHAVIDVDSATETFKRHVDEMFGGLHVGRGHVAFFPAKYRNLILEAGSRMCLMEVVYDGVRRVVEPYSLVYKTRKDGVSSEYFYVYDRTGGRSSGPSIKSFLHAKIGALKLLDKEFEPRYEVELSKAGEPVKNSYFGTPFSGRLGIRTGSFSTAKPRRRRRQVSSIPTGPTYIIGCPYCNKTFRRKKNDTRLNKHKDKYGNPCYGRSGYLKEIR